MLRTCPTCGCDDFLLPRLKREHLHLLVHLAWPVRCSQCRSELTGPALPIAAWLVKDSALQWAHSIHFPPLVPIVRASATRCIERMHLPRVAPVIKNSATRWMQSIHVRPLGPMVRDSAARCIESMNFPLLVPAVTDSLASFSRFRLRLRLTLGRRPAIATPPPHAEVAQDPPAPEQPKSTPQTPVEETPPPKAPEGWLWKVEKLQDRGLIAVDL